jgi:hypothetical protein
LLPSLGCKCGDMFGSVACISLLRDIFGSVACIYLVLPSFMRVCSCILMCPLYSHLKVVVCNLEGTPYFLGGGHCALVLYGLLYRMQGI